MKHVYLVVNKKERRLEKASVKVLCNKAKVLSDEAKVLSDNVRVLNTTYSFKYR
jgi:hypothetical protein